MSNTGENYKSLGLPRHESRKAEERWKILQELLYGKHIPGDFSRRALGHDLEERLGRTRDLVKELSELEDETRLLEEVVKKSKGKLNESDFVETWLENAARLKDASLQSVMLEGAIKWLEKNSAKSSGRSLRTLSHQTAKVFAYLNTNRGDKSESVAANAQHFQLILRKTLKLMAER